MNKILQRKREGERNPGKAEIFAESLTRETRSKQEISRTHHPKNRTGRVRKNLLTKHRATRKRSQETIQGNIQASRKNSSYHHPQT